MVKMELDDYCHRIHFVIVSLIYIHLSSHYHSLILNLNLKWKNDMNDIFYYYLIHYNYDYWCFYLLKMQFFFVMQIVVVSCIMIQHGVLTALLVIYILLYTKNCYRFVSNLFALWDQILSFLILNSKFSSKFQM